MASLADLIADRRKLRRKVSLWRVLGIVGAIVGVLGLGYAFGGRQALPVGGDQIARIKIEGFISGDERSLRLITSVREAKNVKAVIVQVDSPGGTVSGSEAIFLALRQLAAEKPVAAVVTGLAASGGYIAAAAADRIIAQQTSLVGSIGVLFQIPNVTRLLDTVGVNVETIKSSPLKAAPSGFEPTSPEARAALDAVVKDHYDWFKGLVRDRRKLSDSEVALVSDGRVHTGRQGVERKLVDTLGGERQAVEWLETERNVAKSLPVREWRRRNDADRFGLWSASSRLAAAAGFDSVATILARASLIEPGIRLDGALALWQPVVEK
ncbi:MAG: signal peptide peptidase SppA [Hyphomicrobiales bacterium]|nr:signal peptide peptidase SppA [Hyphomicrobiales bacterium]